MRDSREGIIFCEGDLLNLEPSEGRTRLGRGWGERGQGTARLMFIVSLTLACFPLLSRLDEVDDDVTHILFFDCSWSLHTHTHRPTMTAQERSNSRSSACLWGSMFHPMGMGE